MDIQWMLQERQKPTQTGKSLAPSRMLRAGDQLAASVLESWGKNDALLSFDRFNAYARLPLPVKAGQVITIRREPDGGSLRMVLAPSHGRSKTVSTSKDLSIQRFEPVGDKPFLSTHADQLTPGEILRGRMTGFEKEGLQLLDFERFKVFVRIEHPVRRGQIVTLRVHKSEHGFDVAAVDIRQPPNAENRLLHTTARGAITGQPVDGRGTPDPDVAVWSLPPMANGRGTTVSGAGAAESIPPSTVDMARLHEQIQHLVEAVSSQPASVWPKPSNLLTRALHNLQQILSPVSPESGMAELVKRIRDFVENSGIYFEKRLEQVIQDPKGRSTSIVAADWSAAPGIRNLMEKDLKPNLLILKQFIDSTASELKPADRQMLEAFKSVVQRALSHIEQQQHLATQRPVDPDLFQVFSHAMFLTDSLRHARLKIYYAPRKTRSGTHTDPRVSLLLEMNRLGTVRTDLWNVGRALNVTFFVQRADIKAVIENKRHRIGAILERLFDTVAVRVVVNQNKIDAFDGQDLSLSEHRLVDVSA
ncbi:MAG: hypothetical protein PVG51_12595 [Desulfosarcina sp.]|jgi:hypothetical protein